MSELTKEQFEQLPEFVQGDYQEVDGVYKHAGMLKLKGSLNDLDGKYKSQLGELKEQLTGFEETKKAEIEAARQEALAKAKSSGEMEEIERIHKEQMEDLEARVADRVRSEVTTEFTQKAAKDKATSLAAKLAAKLAVDEDSQESLEVLIGLRIKPNDSGELVFYNRDGSASAMTEAELEADIKECHKRLVKGETTTTGGGFANGSMGGGASKKSLKQMTEAERLEWKRRDPDGFKAALNLR